MACFFGHKWNGCRCVKCGVTRNTHHSFVPVPGEEEKNKMQCTQCGLSVERTRYQIVTTDNEILDFQKSEVRKACHRVFDSIVQDDTAFQTTLNSFRPKEDLFDFRTILTGDIMQTPIEYLSQKTGLETQDIQALMGIRLFMTKGNLNLQTNDGLGKEIKYSVTYYFFEP